MIKYPSWKNFVLQTFSNRFDELVETIDLLAFQHLDQRLWKYLLKKSELLNQQIFYITHQEIAQDLGTSREVISRLIKKLVQEKKVGIERNKLKLLVRKE